MSFVHRANKICGQSAASCSEKMDIFTPVRTKSEDIENMVRSQRRREKTCPTNIREQILFAIIAPNPFPIPGSTCGFLKCMIDDVDKVTLLYCVFRKFIRHHLFAHKIVIYKLMTKNQSLYWTTKRQNAETLLSN